MGWDLKQQAEKVLGFPCPLQPERLHVTASTVVKRAWAGLAASDLGWLFESPEPVFPRSSREGHRGVHLIGLFLRIIQDHVCRGLSTVQGMRHMFMRCRPVLLSFLFYLLDFRVQICLENRVCSREYLVIHRPKAGTISKVVTHASRVP